MADLPWFSIRIKFFSLSHSFPLLLFHFFHHILVFANTKHLFERSYA
nr:MAG TPA: hypothetical protein [Caudoviricetes sp.]